MKLLLVVAVIAGCLAHLDASRIIRRDSSGENTGAGTALNGFFATNDNSGNVDGALAAAGETLGGVNDDGGGDTPDTPDSPDSPDGNSPAGAAAAAAGGGGNEVGDTPDNDSPDFDSPNQGRGGFGRPIVKNNGQQATAVDDTGEQASDPEQIVGASTSAGTTAGIVVGVVALVGVAAGVAVYVIKKRN